MDAEVKIMHKLKKLILLVLSISIAPLYLMFSNSTEIEASSNDNNSINYLKLKNKSTPFLLFIVKNIKLLYIIKLINKRN
jgi:hypothetical protein